MFTPADEDNFTINVTKPIGSTLKDSDEAIRTIEEILKEDDRIAKYLVNVGSASAGGQSSDLTSASSSAHLSHITVQLKTDREEYSFDIVDEYQKKLFNVLNDDIVVGQIQGGPPSEAAILVNIIGDDLDEMEKLAQEYKNILADIEGTRNVDTNVIENNGEFLITIDRAKAQLYGLNAMQVAMTLRNAIYGSTATTIQNNKEDIDIIVKYALDPINNDGEKTNATNLNNIDTLTIATPSGDIPLANFTVNSLNNSRAQIQHKEGERIVKVSSSLAKGYTAQEILEILNEKKNKINVKEDIEVTIGGDLENITKSFTDMGKAMLLSIFMIAALLIWQFKSFRQPLFVLSTIPLSLIGVFPGLSLLGKTLDFPGIIGIVALVGIVVNNAIILIDRINENRFAGMDKQSAIKEAGKSRLQPIILTTITTVAGILPLALTSVNWGALGYAIICGLSFSTILTLIVVPLLYDSYGEKELER
jgi:HAE1 family hydrophobic/amphiphilic exporter-1